MMGAPSPAPDPADIGETPATGPSEVAATPSSTSSNLTPTSTEIGMSSTGPEMTQGRKRFIIRITGATSGFCNGGQNIMCAKLEVLYDRGPLKNTGLRIS